MIFICKQVQVGRWHHLGFWWRGGLGKGNKGVRVVACSALQSILSISCTITLFFALACTAGTQLIDTNNLAWALVGGAQVRQGRGST